MKKYVAFALVPLVASCANYCHKDSCKEQPQQASVVYEQQEEDFIPCDCACGDVWEREIQHPRIVEEVPMPQKRRLCEDHQCLDYGTDYIDTFNSDQPQIREIFGYYNPEVSTVQTFVPAQPEGYRLASNRAFNRFIKETYDIYGQDPNLKLYVEKGVLKDGDLPSGIEEGVTAFKGQVANSRIFVLTDQKADADYVLSTTAEWFDTPSSKVPAIKYTTKLFDKDGQELGSWVQIVKKADKKSWL